MAADKVTATLLDVLKSGLTRPGEHRLFKSGKLDGLFPSRTGACAQAAARALRDGLIEVVRTEARGKTSLDWVRLTPRAVDFVHEHDSPLGALTDLRHALAASRDAIPSWQAEMRQSLATLTTRLEDDSRRLTQRLDALAARVDEALERLALLTPRLPDDLAREVPWGADLLAYLNNRRTAGPPGPCPLPELFAAVTDHHSSLSLAHFHEGLRRLHARRVLTLRPATGTDLAQPEFALVDHGQVFYLASL